MLLKSKRDLRRGGGIQPWEKLLSHFPGILHRGKGLKKGGLWPWAKIKLRFQEILHWDAEGLAS